MTESSSRRWHQLHLSTVLLLLFAAGGIVWLNIRGYRETRTITAGSTLGWPWLVEEKLPVFYSESGIEFSRWRYALNLAAALGTLWLAALAAEFVFHGRGRAPLLPPRQWFRLHLSSMLLGTFAAALVLWLNMRPQTQGVYLGVIRYYGWPEIAFGGYSTMNGAPLDLAADPPNYPSLSVNLAVGLLLVLATVAICEFIARRSR